MSFIEISRQNPNVVTKRLDRWGQIFGSNLIIETVNQKMDELYKMVYESVPVRTGYLRSTIKTESGSDFSQISVSAYYAWYVETGARGRRPRPYFYGNVASMSIEMIIAVRELFTMR